MRIDLFQSCGHGWVFQICWQIECSTLIASCFRIWNSSAGIPSPPLVLLAAVLPKVHLTSHYRMSGSGWVTTLSWLSGSLRSFSVVLLSVLAIASWSRLLSLRLYHFCPLLCPSLDEMFLWYFQFSWRDLLVFPFLSSSSTSLHYSLKKAFLSLLVILWNSAFSWVYLSLSPFFYTSLLSSVICKAFSDNHFAFLHFFFFGMVLFAASYTILWTSVHSSLGTPFTRSNSLNLFITSTVYL